MGDSSDCCLLDIEEKGKACSETNEAPCYIDDGEGRGVFFFVLQFGKECPHRTS